MVRPVVHFEVLGADAARLQAFYGELFDWEIDAENPMRYGTVGREGNITPDGVGIGGGIAPSQDGGAGHVTFYVEVPDIEAALAKAQALGASVWGPAVVLVDEAGGHASVYGSPQARRSPSRQRARDCPSRGLSFTRRRSSSMTPARPSPPTSPSSWRPSSRRTKAARRSGCS